MAYIDKESLLTAYKVLSHNTASPSSQGATQFISAIRYLFALDRFILKNNKNCDTKKKDDKESFIRYVGDIVSINGSYYTSNFYTDIKNEKDYKVGSNFFSVNVVRESITNPAIMHDFPRRTKDASLFKVQNGVLFLDKTLYKNIEKYITSKKCRIALAIWMCRNFNFSTTDINYTAVKNYLISIYSKELIEKLIPLESDFVEYTSEYGNINPLPNKAECQVNEILKMFEVEAPIVCTKHQSHITALRTKPFMLLAGISGTGKSRIVREFAFKSCPEYLQDKAGTTPGNYCMIEVKPNWHDSTELLGYYSRLGNNPGYQFTKFVKFLVKAKMYPDVPFFVCLDEMNLAPVEQYFAEILSILETRKHPRSEETGEVDMTMVKTEPIIDAQHFRELSEMSHTKNVQTGEPFSCNLTDREIYLKLFGIDTESDIDENVGNRTDLITEGLTLPDNVVIIGTVNMDDTTHQFSRKVIDRAMTIEMNGGNLRDMFGSSKNLEYFPEEKQEEQKEWKEAFTRKYVTADEVLEAHSDVAEELIDKLPSRLEQINLALKGTPFEVSYRVLNELTIMVGVMLDESKDLNDAINQSVNNILLMKILPRIEGDAEMFALSREYKNKVGVSYDNRLEWLKELAPDIKEKSIDTTSENGDAEETSDKDKEHQQTAKEKIQEMIDRLNNQEFTRFWP